MKDRPTLESLEARIEDLERLVRSLPEYALRADPADLVGWHATAEAHTRGACEQILDVRIRVANAAGDEKVRFLFVFERALTREEVQRVGLFLGGTRTRWSVAYDDDADHLIPPEGHPAFAAAYRRARTEAHKHKFPVWP